MYPILRDFDDIGEWLETVNQGDQADGQHYAWSVAYLSRQSRLRRGPSLWCIEDGFPTKEAAVQRIVSLYLDNKQPGRGAGAYRLLKSWGDKT